MAASRTLPLALGLLALCLGGRAIADENGKAEDPLAQASKRFLEKHDRNADGKLSRDEFPERARRFFERVDKDGDGFVSLEEDLAARKRLKQRRGERGEARTRRRGSSGRKAPEGVTVHRDLEYAKVGAVSLQLDLYVPKGSASKPPLLVWIHGGGWTKGSKEQINSTFIRLTAEGYAAASIQYRLDGLASHPDQIHDCKGAIRWLRAHAEQYGYDARRIAVGGGSAGGHLALLLGFSAGNKRLEGTVGGNEEQSSVVQAVVDLFGPSDLVLFAKENQRFSRRKLPELLAGASPLSYVSKDDPPVIVFHGDKDPVVPLSQSREVERRLKQAGLEVALHVLPGAGHGGLVFSDEERYALIKAFVDKHLKRSKPVTTPAPAPVR